MPDSSGQQGVGLALDPRFDRVQWRVERVAWVVMTLILVAALFGAFGGGGPLSDAASSAGEAEVRYQRLVRYTAPTDIDISVPASDGEARVSFPQSYVANMGVESIFPEPESVEAGEEMVTYIFSAEEGASLVDVTFTFKPERLGMHRAGIQTGEGELSIRQFAFP